MACDNCRCGTCLTSHDLGTWYSALICNGAFHQSQFLLIDVNCLAETEAHWFSFHRCMYLNLTQIASWCSYMVQSFNVTSQKSQSLNEAAHTINNLFVLCESPGCKCKARLVTPFPVRQWSTPSGNYPGNHVLYENIGLPKLWLSISITQWQNRVLDDIDRLSAFLFFHSWLPNLVD